MAGPLGTSHGTTPGTVLVLGHLPLARPNVRFRERANRHARTADPVGPIVRTIIPGITATNLHLRNPEVADLVTIMAETALWLIGLESRHSPDRRHRYLTMSPMKEGLATLSQAMVA